jgi:hypothetical protein
VDGALCEVEAVALHTTAILGHDVFAVFLRVVALREEHAFVSLSLLVFADAAGLDLISLQFHCVCPDYPF